MNHKGAVMNEEPAKRVAICTIEGLSLLETVAICFAAGVIGALAVIIFSQILFASGVSAALGVNAPVPLKSPDVYRPLFWGGLWGIPFGLFIKAVWKHLYVVGLLYFLAPVFALYLIFLPMAGAGLFRASARVGRCSRSTCCW